MANMLVFVMTMTVLAGVTQVSALLTGVGPCACYSLSVYTLEKCSATSLFTVSNPKLTLNADCTLVSEGCVTYGAFTSANVTATVINAATTFTSTSNIDACQALTFVPTEYKALAMAFGWETACPAVGKTVCGNHPVTTFNIAALPYYLEALNFASSLGVTNATLTASHGGASSSCIRIAAEIKKDASCGPLPYPVVGFQNLPPSASVPTSSPIVTIPTLPGVTTTLPACVPAVG